MSEVNRGGSLLLVCFLFSCSPTPPARHPNVPSTAVWTGGFEGGSWIDCLPEPATENGFSCSIFHEDTGELVMKGTFVAHGAEVREGAAALRFEGFDGDRILLHGGGVLEPLTVVHYLDGKPVPKS